MAVTSFDKVYLDAMATSLLASTASTDAAVNLGDASFPEIARLQIPDAYSQTWSVVLAPIPLGTIAGIPAGLEVSPLPINNAFAAIDFGVKGGRARVIVDWPSQGQVVNVSGSFVTVRGGIENLGVPAVGFLPTELSAQIVPSAPMSGQFGAYRTVDYGTLTQGGPPPEPPLVQSLSLPVPRFAKRFWVTQGNEDLSSSTFEVRGQFFLGGPTLWTFFPFTVFGSSSGNLDLTGLRLPQGTNFVELFNGDNNDDATFVRAVYELAF